MDVAQSAPQGAHNHAVVIYLELRRGHRVCDTSGKAYTNSVPENHSLYSGEQQTFSLSTKSVTPVG